MHRSMIAGVVVMLLPATCFGLAFCVSGNEPQSPQNYTDWPGLVDVVNDESRVSLVWVNGDEWLSYRGGTAALNRVLQEFGEVEADELHVILLPAPGPGVAVDVGKADSSSPAEWQLHVLGGISRGVAREFEIESVMEPAPTLRVYVSDQIALNELEIPPKLKLLQQSDIRQRYEEALKNGNDRARQHAAAALERLAAQTPQPAAEGAEFAARLKMIEEFIRERTDVGIE